MPWPTLSTPLQPQKGLLNSKDIIISSEAGVCLCVRARVSWVHVSSFKARLSNKINIDSKNINDLMIKIFLQKKLTSKMVKIQRYPHPLHPWVEPWPKVGRRGTPACPIAERNPVGWGGGCNNRPAPLTFQLRLSCLCLPSILYNWKECRGFYRKFFPQFQGSVIKKLGRHRNRRKFMRLGFTIRKIN